MSRSSSLSLLPRHDGHKQNAQGYYKANNNIVKYGYWVAVILVLFIWLLVRLWKALVASRVSRSLRQGYEKVKLDEHASQSTTVRHESRLGGTRRVIRRWTYLRFASSRRWVQYFAPPSLGQCVFLALYWAFVLAGLWTNVIFKSPVKSYGIQWEVVGFRAAWVSTTQLPLLYATGCRFNIISLMTGITHERLNWFHRWIARTVFMTLIVHWSFFYREWDIAGFVKQEFEIMPMIIWGFAAWAAIGLMVLSGFGWFRDHFFEVWLASHIVLAWAVLALSYTHTHCTTYFVAASVAMLAIDIAGRILSTVLCNSSGRRLSAWTPQLGHRARVEILSRDYLRLTVIRPNFSWKAGQHMFVTIPSIRIFQSHPFTILDANSGMEQNSDGKVSFVIKSHLGFTKDLHKIGTQSTDCQVRAFLQGPYGNPPVVHNRKVAMFIATGNRVSFTLSVLATSAEHSGQLSDIAFHWIVPDTQMISWYREELQKCIAICQKRCIHLTVHIHITRAQTSDHAALLTSEVLADSDEFSIGRSSGESSRSSETSMAENDHISGSRLSGADSHAQDDTSLDEQDDPSDLEKRLQSDDESALLGGTGSSHKRVPSWSWLANMHSGCEFSVSDGRPSADEMIRPLTTHDRGNVTIVAAVPPVLAANMSCVVNRLLEGSNNDIELWIEENGS